MRNGWLGFKVNIERKIWLVNAPKCDVVTWKTVTMAQSRESKFFRSGTVSPVSVLMLNLQPKMCIPRMLQRNSTATRQAGRKHTNAPCPFILVIRLLEALERRRPPPVCFYSLEQPFRTNEERY